MMNQAGAEDFSLEVRRSSRSRRLRLTVTPERVVVSAPASVPERTVMEFLRSRSSWIQEKLNLYRNHPGPSGQREFSKGWHLWLLGERAVLRDFPGYPDEDGLARYLDRVLLREVEKAVKRYGEETGRFPGRVRPGNAGTRWGSCSSRGVVMINRKLVHAPEWIIGYVTFHELVHLGQRNHSSAFWREVEHFFPEADRARKWLRLQGMHLLD